MPYKGSWLKAHHLAVSRRVGGVVKVGTGCRYFQRKTLDLFQRTIKSAGEPEY